MEIFSIPVQTKCAEGIRACTFVVDIRCSATFFPSLLFSSLLLLRNSNRFAVRIENLVL